VSNLKKELKPHLEKMQLDLVFQAGTPATENTILTINRAHEVLSDKDISNKDIKEYKELLELSHKKEVILHELVGIKSSHTGPPIFNLINTGSITVLTPEASAFYNAKVDDLTITDAEYDEIGPNDTGGLQGVGD
jgi:hypothetical protein